MDKETAQRLLALNQVFYSGFAEPFARSRSASDQILTSILPYIPQYARVLDVGCGNGRLVPLLGRERPGSIYVGVDMVPELIRRGQVWADQAEQVEATFCLADVSQPGWTALLPAGPFDCALALAVIHHLPGFDLRARLLGDIAGVLRPEGLLVLSSWQFLENERMRRKIVPWAEIGVAEEALDPGDYLLDWKRGGRGLRYCHLVDRGEMDRLAAASGFRLRETFRAGGREGDLSLFAILVKSTAD
jgi:tRNA (uracil-5-)-methyltransferase TRM9